MAETLILRSVQKALGINDGIFDEELLSAINFSLVGLVQLGVTEFDSIIVDNTTVWPTFNYLSPMLNAVREYVVRHTQIIFDPTASATILQARKDNLTQVEGRLALLVEEYQASL